VTATLFLVLETQIRLSQWC